MKTKFKKLVLLAVLTSFVFAITACDAAPSTGQTGNTAQPSGDSSSAPSQSASSGVPLQLVSQRQNGYIAPDEQNDNYTKVARGENDFAFRFSSALLDTSESDSNFLCSPLSVWLPLAALTNAADDSVKTSLLESIGAAGITEQDLNNAASRMMYDFTKAQENEFREEQGTEPIQPLQIANALFLSNDEKANSKFAQIFADCYGGGVFSTDFNSPQAATEVNKWASDNTDGLITEIVREFPPNTLSAIANAIYFSDRWSDEFNEADTAKDTFNGTKGEQTADFMKKTSDEFTYFEDDSIQAVNLRFTAGGGMVIMLPKDKDANAMLKGMNSGRFTEIIDNSQNRSGSLLLPRFEIKSPQMSLNDSLKAIGVPLFSPENPGITGALESGKPLYISDAVQSAVIKVDEKGTTAAAVTVMAMNTTSLPAPTEPFEMNCNSPFGFILYEYSYDGGCQVIFTGALNNIE